MPSTIKYNGIDTFYAYGFLVLKWSVVLDLYPECDSVEIDTIGGVWAIVSGKSSRIANTGKHFIPSEKLIFEAPRMLPRCAFCGSEMEFVWSEGYGRHFYLSCKNYECRAEGPKGETRVESLRKYTEREQ